MQEMIRATQNYLYEFLNQAEFDQHEIDYRYEHSLRVANIGLELAEHENANKKVVVMGCLLHDLGKFECEKNIEHGRLSAEFAKSFLQTLKLSEKEIADICYSIASHVDGKAGYEYDDIIEAKVVTDADNIDRYSSSKILQAKLWAIRDGKQSVTKEIGYLESRIEKMKSILDMNVLETKSGNKIFKDKLKLNIHFYGSLVEDLKITKEPKWK